METKTVPVKSNSDHEVFKRSDRNHASKGVKSFLYKIKEKSPKMFTSTDIDYFRRSFNCAIAQNTGDVERTAAAIKCIPKHAFNDHEDCNISWCGFLKNPKNYDHKTIPGGYKNQDFFKELTAFFGQLAANAEKFAYLASNQADESF